MLAKVVDRSAFLRALTAPERRRLGHSARLRSAGRGERIWSEGQRADELTFVLRGHVKLVKVMESGRDAILELVGPGELLCASAALRHTPHICTSIALEPTELLSVRRVDVVDVMEQNATASLEMLREVSAQATRLYQRIEELSSGHVEQRLAKLLLRLADSSGEDRDQGGIWVPIPLARQDLADLCGSTLETAIRTMSALAKRGIVTSETGGYRVIRRDALHAVMTGKRDTRRRDEPAPRGKPQGRSRA